MTLEQIITVAIAIAPAVTALAGIIASVVKMKNSNKVVIEKFEEVRQEIFNTKEYKALKDELTVAHQENRELRNMVKELLIAINKVVVSKEE